MKNIIVMGGLGCGLFCATVVGLLGVQGRLNYEGTKGIPGLSLFFDAPPPSEHGEGEDGHAVKAEHTEEFGRKPRRDIEYIEGQSIKGDSGAKAGGAGGGADAHGDEPSRSDPHETGPGRIRRTPEVPGNEPNSTSSRLKREFDNTRMRLESMAPGHLFDLSRIKASGLSAEEINALIERSKKMKQEIETERAVLRKSRRDLEIREQDIADRQKTVTDLIHQVDTERSNVEMMIADFNGRILELRVDEESALKETAGTIASLEPEAAMRLILDYWQSEPGQVKAIKILAVMSREKVDEIIAQMETKQMRDVLEKRMTVARAKKRK